jgi:hypothetical protein
LLFPQLSVLVPVAVKEDTSMRPARKTGTPVKRVTLMLPKVVDQNIEFVAICSGELKTEVVLDALCSHLKAKGINDPFKAPSERLDRPQKLLQSAS